MCNLSEAVEEQAVEKTKVQYIDEFKIATNLYRSGERNKDVYRSEGVSEEVIAVVFGDNHEIQAQGTHNMTSYEKYRKSLEETPGPAQPPADRSYDLRGLYDYIKKTGRDCTELTDEEKAQFVVPLGDVTKGVSGVCKVMEDSQ